MNPASQLPLALDRRPHPTLDNFLPGPNAAALATVRDALNTAEPVWLALAGPAGSGKTHLLGGAVAAATESGSRALMVNGQRLRREADPGALQMFQSSDLLCLDDLHGLLGDAAWEEALFHLLNHLRANRATLIFSAVARTAGLPVLLPDLKSRLATATQLRLQALADEQKKELLLARAAEAGVRIAPEAVELLLKRVPRDLPGLVGWLDRLCAASLAEGRRLSRRFVADKVRAAGE